MESRKTVDVIIPVYRPGRELEELLRRLECQNYPVRKIIVMNTEKKFWNDSWEEGRQNMEVHHLSRREFDHGGTRKKAAAMSDADVLLFMTQDALPENKKLVAELIRSLEEEKVAAAYARQLPKQDCRYLEKYTRSFNYPEISCVKWESDIEKIGIKAFFCSNVCAAYDRKIYEQLGGFVDRAIFNEDMIFASVLLRNGYGVAYAADARVIHSHNYSGVQQFHRNFDLGVSQAEHPEVFADVPSEGEGIRLVKKSLKYLCRTGRVWLIPQLVWQSGCKYAGYFLGKRFRKLPMGLVRKCSMNAAYWEQD